MKKGSLTVFAALTLMLIAQLVFVTLEVARNVEVTKLAHMNTEAAVESVFSKYCSPLWDNYHILAMDGGGGTADFSTDNFETVLEYILLEDNGSQGKDYLRSTIDEIDYEKYTVLTDDSGKVYEKAVGSYMKENLTYEEAKLIYSYFESLKEIEDNSSYDDGSIDDALDALENPEPKENSKIVRASSGEQPAEEVENPLDGIKDTQAKGILSLVLKKGESISGASLDKKDRVSSRKLNKGKNISKVKVDWMDDVLFEQYLITYMSNFMEEKDGRALSYEMEYLIGGKPSDEENLKSVVNRILAIREAANLLYLYTDTAKQEEALALATAVAGATANPVVIDLVKLGLLVAWAYCESILDLRALLQGDKVAAIKSKDNWTSGLSGIKELLSGTAKAKSSKTGLSYKEYIGILILSTGIKTLAKRAMDVQEATVRNEDGYSDVKLDNMICNLKVSTRFEYNTSFSDLVSLLSKKKSFFYINSDAEYEYYKF